MLQRRNDHILTPFVCLLSTYELRRRTYGGVSPQDEVMLLSSEPVKGTLEDEVTIHPYGPQVSTSFMHKAQPATV